MPPMAREKWHQVCSNIFTAQSNMVQMSDSAGAYTSKPWGLGIVDAHAVNHSQKPHPELARSVDCLADVCTGQTRAAVASTCLVDPTWRRLEAEVPDGAPTGKTPAGRAARATYIRSGQWKVMLSTADRWGPFCHAASLYEKDLATKQAVVVSAMGRTCAAEAAKRRLRRRSSPTDVGAEGAATGQVCLPDASGASVEAVASGHGQGCLPDAPDALAPTTDIESETVSSAGGMMADAGCHGLASSVPAPRQVGAIGISRGRHQVAVVAVMPSMMFSVCRCTTTISWSRLCKWCWPILKITVLFTAEATDGIRIRCRPGLWSTLSHRYGIWF